MDKQAFERVTKRIDGYKDEMIELQKKLIAIPAINPESGGDGEAKKAAILEPMVKELFEETLVIKAPDDRVSAGHRPSIVAKTKGKSGDKTIWIMAHLDIVPAGDESDWDTPPFEGVVKDGKIYGRGSEDNNQAIVSAFFVAKALKEEGILPSYNLGILYVADEELGEYKYGPYYILENHRNLFGDNDLVIVPDYGNPEGSAVELAEKSICRLKITITGTAGHAAFPYKANNAHRAGAHLVVKMDEGLAKKYPERDELFDPPMSTFEPTRKEENVPNLNTIPGEDVVCFDCRLLPTLKVDDFLKTCDGYFKEIENEFKVKINYEVIGRLDAADPTPVDSPLTQMVSKAIKEVNGIDAKPFGTGGGTVAYPFRKAGFDTVVTSKIAVTFHQSNENSLIDNMLSDTKVWAHVLMQDK